MTIRSILVPITGAPRDTQALELAYAVARPAAAHIHVLSIRPDPREVLGAVGFDAGAWTAARLIEEAEQDAATSAARAETAFQDWRARHALAAADAPGTRGPTASWDQQTGRIDALVVQAGGAVDLIVQAGLSDDQTALDQIAIEAALFGTGRPELVAPATLPTDALDTAVVAWNGSPESNRAVAAALPLLDACRRVLVFCETEAERAPARPETVIEYLARHGIKAAVLPAAIGHGTIAERLLDTASQARASLLVMGAYTHGRLRQMVFGGVTSHVLHRATMPALLAH